MDPSTLGQDESFWSLLPGLVVGGFGMSLAMTPTAATVLRAVPTDKSGVGSATLNSMRQVGGALGIALMGAIMAHEIGDRTTRFGTPRPDAFVDAFQTTLVVAGLIALAGAVVAATLVRHAGHETPLPAAEAA